MFDELENIYPQKPEIKALSKKDLAKKNLMVFLLMVTVLLFLMQDSIVIISSMFGVIFIHEIGHFIGMKLFKFKDNKIFYFPLLSSFVKQKNDTISQKKHLITLLFGPLPGIIIGTLLLNQYFSTENELLLNISTLFLAINIFSLAPLDPLDGGKIIQSLFFPSNQNIKMYFVLTSSIILIGLGFYFDLYVLMIFGFLMGFKVRSMQKVDSIYVELDEQEINYKKTYKSLTNREYWKIRSIFLDNNPKIKDMIADSDLLWENEKLITDQVNQILRTETTKDASIFFKILVIALVGLAIYIPINLILEHQDIFLKIIADAQI
jgi:Zn-dependent protease